MGRKKDKGKAPSKQESDSPTKALSEHSTDLSKNLNTSKDIKKWIEELSQSPEVLKALRSMAYSSAEDPGTSSKSKAIVSAHDTAIPSQTVGGKELSNPLMAVDLPKIHDSNDDEDSITSAIKIQSKTKHKDKAKAKRKDEKTGKRKAKKEKAGQLIVLFFVLFFRYFVKSIFNSKKHANSGRQPTVHPQ
ncbi:hypothetical protein JCGZ_03953 [Jatropha curcas]|uniref:Uncharacterized protein n=1 Tax=Jatropha curcas TaxID=180498 RepID=A0A067KZP1_JATCU|nr:hypothetical protein JCGZ_03953 [Jatropha curcas]